MCFKCQKYEHHKESCRVHSTCGKWKKIVAMKFSSYQKNHSAFPRTCNVYKREREVEKKCNISRSKKNILESYKKVIAIVAEKVSQINNNQPDKYSSD